ncbi:hypothetical protein OBBRIDRAFT_738887, partial [Obba rivulosa]
PSKLLAFISESSDGINLSSVLRGCYSGDGFFNVILKQPKEHRNFFVKSKLVFMCKKHKKLLCIPNIYMAQGSAYKIVIWHVHSLFAYLKAHKTTGLLYDYVW